MKFDPVLYDLFMAPLEVLWLSRWRREAMALLAPPPDAREWRLLDVGVGTGANLGLYPAGAEVTAIDIDAGMLGRARARLAAIPDGERVTLREMDVMQLDFPDGSFDAALSTLTFCEVPDPEAGLRELHRVLRPGGGLALLEHTRTGSPLVDPVLSALTCVTGPLAGEHLDRDVAAAALRAGFEAVASRPLGLLVFHLVAARKPAGAG